ncbi:Multidrug resistance-associated protein 1 [Thelohanellus kitauei]|uniref:Multidrug resistance-associated protein 1 n=1 Tax=Thelohanellus kitauei TaxID=669202 RepID=A0A0C2MLY0_THEKT|nr:Multidrug resistance-associated protein 1 [Thelohanellus kitauei]
MNQSIFHLLTLSDFNSDNFKELMLAKMGFKYPKVSEMLQVQKGDVLEIVGPGVDWWIKVRKVNNISEQETLQGLVPSSVLVPIKLGYGKGLENVTESEKKIFLPDITLEEMKYFPLFSSFYGKLVTKPENPIKKSNLSSRIFYSWISSYILLGFRRSLVGSDMWIPTSAKTVGNMSNKLQKITPIDGGKDLPLFTTFLSQNKLKFYLAVVCKFLQDIVKFFTPFLIKIFIDFSSDTNRVIWHGFVFCVFLFFIRTVDSLLLNKYYEYVTLMGVDFRCLLSSMVYKKIFTARSDCLSKYPQSFQTNLISVDSYRVQDGIIYMIMVWSCILQIILCLIYLYFVMGLAFLAGVGVILIVIPINFIVVKISRPIEVRQMQLKDERMKLITAIFNGIKLVKLYAWEVPFQTLTSKIRKKELKQISKLRALNSIIYTCMIVVPVFITLATFFTYIQLKEYIGASVAFESMAIFNILRFPLGFLPDSVQTVITARISYGRFKQFLSYPDQPQETNYLVVKKKDGGEAHVSIKEANFSFSEGTAPFLTNINMEMNFGSLHIIVGENGSGKTKLLQSLLNETIIVSGKVEVCGKISFVPQTSWIRNASLRDNILDRNPFDRSQYQNVIDLCELRHDIELLQDGDETEIGEKGINLSGGQKQRVGLARAIYTKSDIYLLDDPLSNLDKNVGQKVFQNLFSSSGYLSKKLRILVTHDDRFLSQADCIYLMKEGKIINSGQYHELLSKDPYFQNFVSKIKATEEKNKEISEPAKSPMTIAENDGEKAQRCKLVQADVIMRGQVKRKIYSEYIKSQTIPVFVLFVISIPLHYALNMLGSIVVAQYTSLNIYKHNSTNFFKIYGILTGGQCALLLIIAGFQILATYLASTSIHSRLMTSLFGASIRFFESTPVGRIFNAFTSEMSIIDNTLSQSVKLCLFLLFNLVFSLIGICYFLPYMLIGIGILAIVYMLIQAYYIKSSRQIQRLESLSRAPIISLLGDTINGLSIIRSSQHNSKYIDEFDDLIDTNSVPFKMNMFCNRWLGVRLEIIGNLITLISAISIVIKCSVSSIAQGAVGYILFVSTSITQTSSYFIRYKCEVETQIISIERISALYNAQQELTSLVVVSPEPTWPQSGCITFTNYSCKYRPHLPDVLHALSFTIEPSQKVGVVGRTGSGKSSLLLSLFRMIERSEGSIEIDGVNIDEIPLDRLRSSLTIIPQDPFLFHGTLRQNLDPANLYNDPDILKAIGLSQLSNFVNNLPDGLDYMIDEFGSNISSGEKQLICLARALLKHTKILILDEATSNIDLKMDSLIQETISREFADCTVITVAHRIETIVNYEKILVLDKGSVAEFDSPQNLLSRNDSLFASMVAHAENSRA